MLTYEEIARQNAPKKAENAILNCLWFNKSFSDSIMENEDYDRKYLPKTIAAEPKKGSLFVKNILKGIQTEEDLYLFVNPLRKTLVSPFYKTNDEYIRKEWETDLTMNQLLNMIRLECSNL